ncbi:hypothetical protein J6590_062245, partial [Homalodisca vitripennis]
MKNSVITSLKRDLLIEKVNFCRDYIADCLYPGHRSVVAEEGLLPQSHEKLLGLGYSRHSQVDSLKQLWTVNEGVQDLTNEPLFHESAVYCTLTNQSQRLTYQGSVLLPTLQATARLTSTIKIPPGARTLSATADHTYSTRDFMPHVLLSHLNISFYLYLLHIYINIKVSALDWQSLPERLCSRTPASTVLYRTGHSVMNYSFAVVLC